MNLLTVLLIIFLKFYFKQICFYLLSFLKIICFILF